MRITNVFKSPTSSCDIWALMKSRVPKVSAREKRTINLGRGKKPYSTPYNIYVLEKVFSRTVARKRSTLSPNPRAKLARYGVCVPRMIRVGSFSEKSTTRDSPIPDTDQSDVTFPEKQNKYVLP